jgi:predicted RNA-binding Zn ribbon-like protein
MAQSAAAHVFEFSGGELCLDFVNTVGDRREGRNERLLSWTDVLAWGEQAGLVSRREASALRAAAETRSRGAARAFDDAVALRECLYRIFKAVAIGRRPAGKDVAVLNDAVGETMAHARVESSADGFSWGWTEGPPSFDRMLWPVVRSAADLLVSSRRADVRECASGTCTWLFIDSSPTRRRRWCDMKTCGNRDKARRFYRRKQAAVHRSSQTLR